MKKEENRGEENKGFNAGTGELSVESAFKASITAK